MLTGFPKLDAASTRRFSERNAGPVISGRLYHSQTFLPLNMKQFELRGLLAPEDDLELPDVAVLDGV